MQQRDWIITAKFLQFFPSGCAMRGTRAKTKNICQSIIELEWWKKKAQTLLTLPLRSPDFHGPNGNFNQIPKTPRAQAHGGDAGVPGEAEGDWTKTKSLRRKCRRTRWKIRLVGTTGTSGDLSRGPLSAHAGRGADDSSSVEGWTRRTLSPSLRGHDDRVVWFFRRSIRWALRVGRLSCYLLGFGLRLEVLGRGDCERIRRGYQFEDDLASISACRYGIFFIFSNTFNTVLCFPSGL